MFIGNVESKLALWLLRQKYATSDTCAACSVLYKIVSYDLCKPCVVTQFYIHITLGFLEIRRTTNVIIIVANVLVSTISNHRYESTVNIARVISMPHAYCINVTTIH